MSEILLSLYPIFENKRELYCNPANEILEVIFGKLIFISEIFEVNGPSPTKSGTLNL